MPLTVKELQNFFFSKADWVNPEATADRIEVGNPDTEIKKIGTGWSACMNNLKAAAEDNCNLYITHEPSFCEFWEPDGGTRDTEWGKMRIDFLNENNMVLMSLHDTWDFFPEYGIRDSWMQYLGYTSPLKLEHYERNAPGYPLKHPSLTMHEIKPTTLKSFAKFIADKLKPLRCGGVTVNGNLDTEVKSFSIGVGCHIPTFEMLKNGCDVMVMVYDRAFQSTVRTRLNDLGANTITVEHGAVEMPGMENCAKYIHEQFPEIETKFYMHEVESVIIS
jgi:putative NIF3 family GTP cyclohydrolase 1 type 2